MKKIVLIAALSVMIVAAAVYGWIATSSPRRSGSADRAVFVEKVIDGDSLEAMIQGRREQVRLIGIDAPEMGQRPWGRRSKRHLEELVSSSGWELGIEYDVDTRDKYGRILCYFWTRGGSMVNEEMVRAGQAVIFTFPPNVKYLERFRTAQVIARENGIGIWGNHGLRQMPSSYRKDHPRK